MRRRVDEDQNVILLQFIFGILWSEFSQWSRRQQNISSIDYLKKYQSPKDLKNVGGSGNI